MVHKRYHLPYWCNYIAWTIVFLACLVAAFFTILYSMQWGSAKAGDWLKAFLLSFIESLIIIQPVKVGGNGTYNCSH